MDRSSKVQVLRDRLPDGAVSAAKGVVHATGRATSGLRVRPDFLIIGCKKGGTTSLMNWLVEHPHVARMHPSFQRRKSPNYFDINYAKGDAWYRAHFPTRRALVRAERRTGRRPIVGEASPYYMFHPAAPERVGEIAAANGIVLHELSVEHATLEEVFLELTGEPGERGA